MLVSRLQGNVRNGAASDADQLAHIHNLSWRDAYCGVISRGDLDMLVKRRNAPWWRRALINRQNILVIEVGGTVGGYAMYGCARGQFAQQGEIFELYLGPEYQGLGLGELLFEGCRARLDSRSFNGLVVWALRDNVAAISFYRRRGGRVVTRRCEMVGESQVEKVALVWD